MCQFSVIHVLPSVLKMSPQKPFTSTQNLPVSFLDRPSTTICCEEERQLQTIDLAKTQDRPRYMNFGKENTHLLSLPSQIEKCFARVLQTFDILGV
jgi:hypothetical protein